MVAILACGLRVGAGLSPPPWTLEPLSDGHRYAGQQWRCILGSAARKSFDEPGGPRLPVPAPPRMSSAQSPHRACPGVAVAIIPLDVSGQCGRDDTRR